MAHIPMDDVQQLWRETNPKNWAQFFKVVHAHRGKANGISDNLIVMMEQMQPRLEHTPFPNSPEQMMEVLNKQLAGMEHGGRA